MAIYIGQNRFIRREFIDRQTLLEELCSQISDDMSEGPNGITMTGEEEEQLLVFLDEHVSNSDLRQWLEDEEDMEDQIWAQEFEVNEFLTGGRQQLLIMMLRRIGMDRRPGDPVKEVELLVM